MFYHHKVNVPIVLGNLSLKLGRSIRLDPKTEWIVGDDEAARLSIPVSSPVEAPTVLERLEQQAHVEAVISS